MSSIEDEDGGDVVLTTVPEHATPAMVQLLGELVDGFINNLPFTFACSDLMNALLYSVASAGLQHNGDPEALKEDCRRAIGEIVNDVVRQNAERRGSLN